MHRQSGLNASMLINNGSMRRVFIAMNLRQHSNNKGHIGKVGAFCNFALKKQSGILSGFSVVELSNLLILLTNHAIFISFSLKDNLYSE